MSSTPLDELEADLLGGKPVADALRRCIVLGGRLQSATLRDWAAQELKGYNADDEVPPYRTVGAVIQLDAVLGNGWITGQRISPNELPEFARESIEESFTFRDGIGGIEALISNATDNHVKLSIPMANDLGRLMDDASSNPFQKIMSIYWSVSVSALAGIVDQVKSRLAELIAELRATTSATADLPGPAAADQAINVAIHGAKRVSVNTAQATSGSEATITAPDESATKGFWSNPRWLGLTGFASLLLIWVGLTAPLRWWPFN